jgi:uncharacterized protein (TIGR00290 family)
VSAREPVLMAWSGGKDSALALAEVLRGGRYDVAALLTTVTEGYDRVSMHGVRRTLLRQQAEAIGLRLDEVVIPPQCANDEYEARMAAALAAARTRSPGLRTVVFGDLFLTDIRAYRERMLALIGMEALFPLWLRDTNELAREFVRSGYRAVLVCVDSHALPAKFAGREFSTELLDELPAGVDPCGENGEFHTFVYAGPLFAHRIPHRRGKRVVRERRFVYRDLEEVPR